MIKLNENIKKYRQKKDMTQSQLATVFGVSEQAVSRWENGNTYPDITLLPAIADYFDISLDELMGMENYKDEKETEKIIAMVKENERKGLISKNIKLLTEAAKKHPTNYVILKNLVTMLNFEYCEDESKLRSNSEKALELSDRILNECHDKSICDFIYREKILALNNLGRVDEAVEMAEKLPTIWDSSNVVFQHLLTGSDLKKHLKNNAMQFAQALYWTIHSMSDLRFQDESLSTRDRINIAKKGLDLLDLVYEGNYGGESRLVAQMNRYIAALEALEKNEDATLCHLELAVKYAIACDTLPDLVEFTSTLLSGSSYRKSTTFKNYTWTECTELNECLSQQRYDFIRSSDRFKEIEKRISEYVTAR